MIGVNDSSKSSVSHSHGKSTRHFRRSRIGLAFYEPTSTPFDPCVEGEDHGLHLPDPEREEQHVGASAMIRHQLRDPAKVRPGTDVGECSPCLSPGANVSSKKRRNRAFAKPSTVRGLEETFDIRKIQGLRGRRRAEVALGRDFQYGTHCRPLRRGTS